MEWDEITPVSVFRVRDVCTPFADAESVVPMSCNDRLAQLKGRAADDGIRSRDEVGLIARYLDTL